MSSKHLFKFDADAVGPGVDVSADGSSVSGVAANKSLCLGTVGFASGVHYWEVRVDASKHACVFIGVARKAKDCLDNALPASLCGWRGWGFVNFRATMTPRQAESVYGDFFHPGQTVGVRLDMEAGRLSFSLHGEQYGQHTHVDFGRAFTDDAVAFRELGPLYPAVGVHGPGNKLSLSHKWLSCPGVSSHRTITDAAWCTQLLQSWGSRLTPPVVSTPAGSRSHWDHAVRPAWQRLASEAWSVWQRWAAGPTLRVRTRTGVEVELDARPATCRAIGTTFVPGDMVKVELEGATPETGIVLGVYRGFLVRVQLAYCGCTCVAHVNLVCGCVCVLRGSSGIAHAWEMAAWRWHGTGAPVNSRKRRRWSLPSTSCH